MQQENLIKVLKYINAKTDIATPKLFFEYLKDHNKYKISPSDYKIYEFYKLTKNEKENIITKGQSKQAIKRLNKLTNVNEYKLKNQFYKKYNSYLNRHWLELTGSNIAEFYDFANKYTHLLSTTNDITISKNTITPDLKNYTKLYNELVLNGKSIIEEPLTEMEPLSSLNPNAFNIIRMITLNNEIIYSYLITMYNETELFAPINIETGIIDYDACDLLKNTYDFHPITSQQINWLTIPKWPRTKRFTLKVALENPDLKYQEIDLIMSLNGPALIKINPSPNYQNIELMNLIYQKDSLKKLLLEEGE